MLQTILYSFRSTRPVPCYKLVACFLPVAQHSNFIKTFAYWCWCEATRSRSKGWFTSKGSKFISRGNKASTISSCVLVVRDKLCVLCCATTWPCWCEATPTPISKAIKTVFCSATTCKAISKAIGREFIKTLAVLPLLVNHPLLPSVAKGHAEHRTHNLSLTTSTQEGLKKFAKDGFKGWFTSKGSKFISRGNLFVRKATQPFTITSVPSDCDKQGIILR